ncbi:MAG: hypothetical protein ACR2GY_08215 [Phycisphaerales bacterium]
MLNHFGAGRPRPRRAASASPLARSPYNLPIMAEQPPNLLKFFVLGAGCEIAGLALSGLAAFNTHPRRLRQRPPRPSTR